MRRFVLLAVVVAACAPPVEPPHVLFSQDVASLDNPFPDARFIVNGSVQLRDGWYRPFLPRRALTPALRKLFDGMVDQAKALSAFGNFGSILLRTSEPLDASTLEGHFVRLAKRDGAWVVVERSVETKRARDVFQGAAKASTDVPDYLFLRPHVAVVQESALVVLAGVKTESGVALGPGNEWLATKPQVAEFAKALGVAEKDVLFVLPLPSRDPRPPMRALADFAKQSRPVATIPAKGVLSTSPHLYVGRWSMDVPADYAVFTPWFNLKFPTPSSHVGGLMMGTLPLHDARDANGQFLATAATAPASTPIVDVHFVLVTPKGTKPAGGWPTIIAGHGLNDRNTPQEGEMHSFCLELGEVFAAKGYACLGIDAPNHGSRGNFFDFFNPTNLGALRDRFREQDFDLMQLAAAAPGLDADGDGQGDLSPHLSYFGMSLGGIMGAGAVPYIDSIEAAVLNVPGGGLTNILVAPGVGENIALLVVATTDLTYGSAEADSVMPVFRCIAQLFVDEGDGVVLSVGAPKTQALLLQMSVGDQTVPNDTTLDVATSLDVTPLLGPLSGTEPLRVLSRTEVTKYWTASQVQNNDPHDAYWKTEVVRTQASQFITSRGRAVDPLP